MTGVKVTGFGQRAKQATRHLVIFATHTNAIDGASVSDDLRESIFDPRPIIFNFDVKSRSWKQLEHGFQSWDTDISTPKGELTGQRSESITRIQRFESIDREVRHHPRSLGRSIDGGVVHEHQHAIGGHMHIRFDHVGVIPIESESKGFDRVFGSQGRASTMGDMQRWP
jgi:hypothetical protein